MVVVSTNISALRSAEAMRQAENQMGDAMERLSTGLRINSAADDAAGSAIASKMEAQTRSLGVAIRNANDAISMTQTAEGALGEVENILQRMRELAVQGGNNTLNASDRAQIQSELDALSDEIDAIASTTNFNGINLLDGSNASLSFQVGIQSDSSLKVDLTKADAASLGLNGASQGATLLTSERVSEVDMSGVANSDIKLNGHNFIAAAALGDYSGGDTALPTTLANLINANTSVHGAKATAYNSVTSAPVGDDFVMTTSFTINSATIEVVSSYQELVNEINQEATGVVAVLNSDNTITLSNDDGGQIAFSAAQGATDVGFTANAAATTFNGFVALENVDGSDVVLTAANDINGFASGAGTLADVNLMGFNQVNGTTITGAAVSSTDVAATDLVKINGVLIDATSDGSAASKAAAINAKTDEHGVTATATTQLRLEIDFTNIDMSNVDALNINGVDADLSGDVSMEDSVDGINGTAGLGGDIVASTDSAGRLVLTSLSGANIVVTEDSDEQDMFAATTQTNQVGAAVTESSHVLTAYGSLTLTTDGGFIDLEDGTATAGDGLAKFGLQGSSMESDQTGAGLSVNSAAAAGASLTAIDDAIVTVSTFRAGFGATENRLDKAINNLTTYKVNLEAAKGRIEDANFAGETSVLTKAQILNQAATSMLAQANASKQNLLALLQ